MKNTKKALLTSVLALVLCMSMLVGSTFAWFTDTDTAAISNIVSGTLDIEIVDEQGNVKTDALDFVNADGSANILWEPGATFRTEGFQLRNVGSLWLKYKITVNNTEVSYHKLNEAIKFSLVKEDGTKIDLATMKDIPLAPNGGLNEEGLLYIEGHMDENAGNEYQDLTLSGVSITVNAAQYTSEKDMTDDQYDATAPYVTADEWDGTLDIDGLNSNTNTASKTVTITTAEQMAALVAAINDGGAEYRNYTINLDVDIDLKSMKWTPINAWDGVLNGTTINGNGHTIKNMTIEGGESAGFISNNASSLTVKNLNFDGAVVKPNAGNYTYSGVVIGKNYSVTTLENVHVKNSKVISNWQCGGLVGFAEGNAPVFNNCSISDSFAGGSNCTAGAFFGLGVVDVTINGGSATNVDLYTDMEPGLVGHLYYNTLTNNGCTVDVKKVDTTPTN